MMITSMMGVVEHLQHLRRSPDSLSSTMSDKTASKLYVEFRELLEELCYFMGSLSYAVGSVLFEPIFATHFKNVEVKQDIWQWAVVMFILGSA